MKEKKMHHANIDFEIDFLEVSKFLLEPFLTWLEYCWNNAKHVYIDTKKKFSCCFVLVLASCLINNIKIVYSLVYKVDISFLKWVKKAYFYTYYINLFSKYRLSFEFQISNFLLCIKLQHFFNKWSENWRIFIPCSTCHDLILILTSLKESEFPNQLFSVFPKWPKAKNIIFLNNKCVFSSHFQGSLRQILCLSD